MTPVPESTAARVPVSHPSLDRPPVTRRWALPLIAIAILGVGGVVAFEVTRGRSQRGSTPVTEPSTDANRSTPDSTSAALDAATIDPDSIPAAADAVSTTPDAKPTGSPRRDAGVIVQPRRDAGTVTPPARDATVALPPDAPTVDIIRDAGVKPDAKPDIDIIVRPKPKQGN
jgi:hypothetical protein